MAQNQARMMKGANQIDPELRSEMAGIAENAGCDLLDCEFAGGVLRLILDRPEGVTLDDCQAVSKQVSALLDVMEYGSGRYLLEVSSPGLDRKLFGRQDYDRFQGRRVRVTFRDPTTDRKRTVVGDLVQFRPNGDDKVTLVDASTDEEITISLKNIELARLVPEL